MVIDKDFAGGRHFVSASGLEFWDLFFASMYRPCLGLVFGRLLVIVGGLLTKT